MNNPYDIEEAFATIEEELIESMIRNMKRHKAEEDDEGFHWEMWQAKQLESLKRYKAKNRKVFPKRFAYINERMEELIKEANKDGYMEQEKTILEAIKNGFKGHKKASNTMQAEFFKLNERKLEALIKATTNDMQKAETAILRMAEDKYRQVIFNAQVYANTGAGTYEKAVDMATKDMLTAGLNCVEYANGSRHRLKDYADMAIRTASKRAYLQGEGTKRQEWGISTVIVNKRGNPCPKCLPFCGKVLIDDVWSGGKASDGPYPLVSDAIEAGLYHPRCRDSHTTYFEGLDDEPDDLYTKDEIDDIEQNYLAEQKQQYAKRQAEKFGRLEKHSLDKDNKRIYQNKAKQWKNEIDGIETYETSKQNLISNENAKKVSEELKEKIKQHTTKDSKWSGNINVDNEKCNAIQALGIKEWNCNIVIKDEAREHVILHELLHSCSISHYDEEEYVRFFKTEEAAVELFTQEIAKKEGIEYTTEVYKDYVDILRNINHKFVFYESDYDFAKFFFELEPNERFSWLNNMITECIMKENISIQEAQEIFDYVNNLEDLII